MGFMGLALQKHFQKGKEAGLKLPLAFVSYVENLSSGRKEGIDRSRGSPEMISEVNTQW